MNQITEGEFLTTQLKTSQFVMFAIKKQVKKW